MHKYACNKLGKTSINCGWYRKIFKKKKKIVKKRYGKKLKMTENN